MTTGPDDWQPTERDQEIVARWATEISPAFREHWQFLEEILQAHHSGVSRADNLRARHSSN
jgi:hypothetical protein